MKGLTCLLFVVSAGPEFGLGHLRRMQAVARAYRKVGGQGPVDFYLLGCTSAELSVLDQDESDGTLMAGSRDALADWCASKHYDAVIVDLHKQHIGPQLFQISQQLQRSGVHVVAIDHVAIQPGMHADLRWVPSFFKDPAWPDHLDIHYGWDHYLIEKRLETAPLPNKNRLLVLTGGSDSAGLGAIWPHMLEEGIEQPLEIHWVQGPFSERPDIPPLTKHQFIIHLAPKGLDHLINACDRVLTVHGISVFEALMYRRDCVVFNPYPDQNSLEITSFEESGVALVARSHKHVIAGLQGCWADQKSPTVAKSDPALPDGQGPVRLLQSVAALKPDTRTKASVV